MLTVVEAKNSQLANGYGLDCSLGKESWDKASI